MSRLLVVLFITVGLACGTTEGSDVAADLCAQACACKTSDTQELCRVTYAPGTASQGFAGVSQCRTAVEGGITDGRVDAAACEVALPELECEVRESGDGSLLLGEACTAAE